MDYFIAANWKMHGRSSWAEMPAQLKSLTASKAQNVRVIILPPALYLADIARNCEDAGFSAGAQNCYFADDGAYTGEVNPHMVADCGGQYVICGHSERRTLFGESDDLVAQKAKSVHKAGLTAIICIGESLETREEGAHMDLISTQIEKSLPDTVTAINTIIAYEPIWAIGTGKTASLKDIAEMHRHIRAQIRVRFGAQTAENIAIQYGGSVKPANAREILALDDVNGALVGGASLDMESFAAIVNAAGANKA